MRAFPTTPDVHPLLCFDPRTALPRNDLSVRTGSLVSVCRTPRCADIALFHSTPWPGACQALIYIIFPCINGQQSNRPRRPLHHPQLRIAFPQLLPDCHRCSSRPLRPMTRTSTCSSTAPRRGASATWEEHRLGLVRATFGAVWGRKPRRIGAFWRHLQRGCEHELCDLPDDFGKL